MGLILLIARFTPKKIRENITTQIRYSKFKMRADAFIGWAVVLGLALSAITAAIIHYLEYLDWYFSFPVLLFGFEFIFYLILGLNVNSKTAQVEAALPDALQLMSSNIRAGLTTDKAMIMAARPEFGPLEKEIRRVGKETMAGRSLSDALSRMTLFIRSSDLERTLELITNSLKSGGELADLLDSTADDIREQQLIRKEIAASVLMYVLFIFIAISIGAPVLFSMSSFLVELLSKNMEMIANELPSNFDGMEGAPIKMGGGNISTEFIRQYALVSIASSCLFGSMIMGLILKGEEKEGLKYFLPMVIIAYVLFFGGTFILQYTIGGMLPQ